MAKAETDDGAPAKGKAARRLGLATVAKPCLVGAFMLSALHVVLGH
jgi:hypothetical protein